MALRKNYIAIKTLPWLLAVALAGIAQAGAAHAEQVVGTITDLSGPLLVHRANGVDKVLSQKSTIEQGDVLVSEKDTYARIKFVDNSEITLRPNTQFKVENFSYDADKPENDHAIFGLIRGGLRSITGLLGKRNKDRYGLNTPTATIGIRGTIFIAEYIPPTQSQVAAFQAASLAAVSSAQYNFGGLAATSLSRTDAPQDFLPKEALKPLQLAQNTGSPNGLNPGLYVQVLDGTIHVTNGGGTQNFTAGQFGFTPGFQQPPVILPNNPGLQFTPPPSFSSTSGSQGGTGGSKPGDVNCQVR
jgi:hypothetical protein